MCLLTLQFRVFDKVWETLFENEAKEIPIINEFVLQTMRTIQLRVTKDLQKKGIPRHFSFFQKVN